MASGLLLVYVNVYKKSVDLMPSLSLSFKFSCERSFLQDRNSTILLGGIEDIRRQFQLPIKQPLGLPHPKYNINYMIRSYYDETN